MSNLADEMRAFWRGDKLQQASRSGVNGLMIPQSSKEFLVAVGLPTEEIGLTRFELKVDRVPTLTEHAKALKLVPPAGTDRCRLIGRGNLAPDLFIDESANGAVVEVSLDPPWKRFVNSSVEQLGAFLLAYAKGIKDREAMTDAENAEYVKSMKAKLELIDPAALADSDHWWALVLEQMEDGLL